MPSSTNIEYITNPQDVQFDYESDPHEAMQSYAKMMHSHTKQQMDAATVKCRRRSAVSSVVDPNARLPTADSGNSSRSSF